jgi:hypothetical protein
MRHLGLKGALFGLAAGLVALAGVFAVALQCLPYRISQPPPPWPWHCADPAYGVIGYLAFPANLLTNDLAQAVFFAPLSLLIYSLLGALIGSRLTRRAS